MALKKSSEQIQISASVQSTTAGAFSTNPIDLQLNPLDNEVFVVEALVVDFVSPVFVDTSVAAGSLSLEDRVAVSTTRPSAMPTLADSNTIGTAFRNTTASIAGGNMTALAIYEQHSMENPSTMLERLGIIATNDFFISVQCDSSIPQTYAVRLYGYRARADAATYAALVQSEVLSS